MLHLLLINVNIVAKFCKAKMTTERLCLECESKLRGRKDQKFCSRKLGHDNDIHLCDNEGHTC